MFANKVALVLAVAFLGVQAQNSATSPAATSTAGLSPCLINCVSQAGTCSLTDTQCACTNTDFQGKVASCLATSCSQAEQAAATQVQQAQCAGVTATSAAASSLSSKASATLSGASSEASAIASSASAAISNLSSKASSVASSATSAAASLTSTSSSAGDKVELGLGAALAFGVTVFGAIGGGLLL